MGTRGSRELKPLMRPSRSSIEPYRPAKVGFTSQEPISRSKSSDSVLRRRVPPPPPPALDYERPVTPKPVRPPPPLKTYTPILPKQIQYTPKVNPF